VQHVQKELAYALLSAWVDQQAELFF